MIFLALTPFSSSLLPTSLSLLLHLSFGFKRLSSSFAPRSNWPLPFICQPFDVVPGWAACYALPLTARPEVRTGLYFSTPPHLNTLPAPLPVHNHHHLLPPLQMCLCPTPTPNSFCPPLPLPCLVPIIIL